MESKFFFRGSRIITLPWFKLPGVWLRWNHPNRWPTTQFTKHLMIFFRCFGCCQPPDVNSTPKVDQITSRQADLEGYGILKPRQNTSVNRKVRHGGAKTQAFGVWPFSESKGGGGQPPLFLGGRNSTNGLVNFVAFEDVEVPRGFG